MSAVRDAAKIGFIKPVLVGDAQKSARLEIRSVLQIMIGGLPDEAEA